MSNRTLIAGGRTVTLHRLAHGAAATLLAIAVAWPWIPHAAERRELADVGHFEWPHEIDGETLRPLALGDVERRFAARFPGEIARFASHDSVWILRRVERPTRMLHPAADCYRGLGYLIRDEHLTTTGSGLQRCFAAVRQESQLRVCERIVDADGQSFTDTSAWYWAAALGRSRGPWLASTRAE